MDLLYNVVNREFDVSSRKGRVAYLDFIAECQQDLDQLRFRKEHQFDFGVNNTPLMHWDYLALGEEGLICRLHLERPQTGYLFLHRGKGSSTDLHKASKYFAEQASGLMDLKLKLEDSEKLAAELRERMAPVTGERGITKQRKEAFSVVWELDRLVRISEAQTFYVSVVVR